MPNPGISKAVAEQAIATVQACIDDGFTLSGSPSALQEAARRLNLDDGTLASRVRAAKRKFGLEPVAKADAPLEVPAGDAVADRRKADDVAHWKARAADAERRAAAAEDIRAGVLGLTQDPLVPRLSIPTHKDRGAKGRTVILHLSDVHHGETVSLEEMDGTNTYNAEISRARLGRFFGTSAELMTDHWSGSPPDEIILCLGGDLVSGLIHDELLQTNFPSVPHTVRDVGELIAGGILHLAKTVKRPIRVYSVPGNHGRLSHKPQSKGRAAGSLDLLATDFAEATLRGTGIKNVSFYRTASPDAHFSTYGWHWLLTHGDTMGGRGGGTGFIGPIASIAKGHRKLVDTSWRTGRPVHYVLTAHYHTTCKTAFGWANGSVIGYGEYARDLRADPEPARQNFLVVHPRHGVINEQPLYLGVQSEGSHYAGPASIIRPQFDEAA